METTKTKTTQTTQTVEKTPIVKLSQKGLANTLVNKFNGFQSLEEEQGRKIGMIFATIGFNKPMKMRKFHRTEKTENGKKLPNPYKEIREVGKLQVEFNGIWQNKVDNVQKRVDGIDTGFKANEKRSNGIENYNDSRVVCFHPKFDRFYLNYIVKEYLGDTVYLDDDFNKVDYADVAEYHQKPSKESKEKEAEKHGVTVEQDAQIRQIKFDNIVFIRIFGVEYRIQE